MDATAPPASAPITCAAYARHRGVSAMSVSRAIARGRLSKSVVREANGTPRISNPELADQEWDENTDLSKAPGYVKARADAAAPRLVPVPTPPAPVAPAPGEELGEEEEEPEGGEGLKLGLESAREKHWKAKLAELKYREREGELVEAKLVEKKLAGTYAQVRTKLLGVPSRARQLLPHLNAADVGVLEDLVREALEDLVEDEEESAESAPVAAAQ
jgi:hypothetical protein